MMDLPAEIAVFPLSGAVLLPEGRLPLNIFEPRYLALIDGAMAAGRYMGMVQPRLAEGETVGDVDPMYEVGCLGRISEFAEVPGGRFTIALTGVTRFRIVRELEMRDGYRRVVADYTAYADDLNPPVTALDDREPLLTALRNYAESRGMDIDWPALESTPDPALIAALTMGCPFAPEEKQSLLEAPTLADRAERLRAIAEMAAHGDPAQPATH